MSRNSFLDSKESSRFDWFILTRSKGVWVPFMLSLYVNEIYFVTLLAE